MVRSWLSHSHSGTREIAGLAALYGLYEVIRGAGTENVQAAMRHTDDIVATVAAPAHLLPLEYMAGPYRYTGTYRGEPVGGFAFYERSMALHRDWELADVLEVAEPGERDEVAQIIDAQR